MLGDRFRSTYTFQQELKGELFGFVVNINQNGQVSGLLVDLVVVIIHSGGKTIFILSYLEGITLSAGEAIYDVARRASDVPSPSTFSLEFSNLVILSAPLSHPTTLPLTDCVSTYFDSHLKPIVQSFPSFIRDTNHFLNILALFS